MERINISYELRPCLIGEKKRKALFHQWVSDAYAGSVAIVEYEDGSVARVTPKNIHFLDSNEKFEGYDWDEAELRKAEVNDGK